jgi:ADP-ribose pyrophosphatase
MSSEAVQVYLAQDLSTAEGGPHPDDDEDLERSWVPLTEAIQRVRAGQITNAPAMAGHLAASA